MSKRKLLLADDSITIQKVVNLTFADEGIEVITVGDGDAAMKKFVESMPDLVMADVNMPGIGGYQICEMIKQDEETNHIPVILLVGSFEPFDEEEAHRVGADDYLTKPFQSIRQLVNKVTELLNSANGEQPARIQETSPDQTASAAFYEETADAELGDAGMDDDMIQTSQIGSLPIDEPQKFESDSVESTFQNIPATTLRSPYHSDLENTAQYQSEGDFAKTQPLTTQEFKHITESDTEDETALAEEKEYEIAGEQDYEPEEISVAADIIEPPIVESQPYFEPEEITEHQFSEPESANETGHITADESEPADTYESVYEPAETSESIPAPQAASVLDLDEMNLLELPPREKIVPPNFQVAPTETQESDFQTISDERQESDFQYASAGAQESDFQYAPVEPEEPASEIAEEPAAENAEMPQTERGADEDYSETAGNSAELISLSPQSIEAIAERVADLVLQKLAQASVDEE